jgi:uncharacterized membrane protein YidH (DUF202 family)
MINLKLALGVVLIILGLLALIYGKVPYTEKKEIMQVGPLRAEVKTEEELQIPPIVGGLVLASGVALIFLSRKTKK